MEVPLPPGDMGGRGPGTARGHGRKGARGCTGTRGEGARGHGDTAEGARDFSSEAQGQPEQRAPTPSESAHLQAGQDEVHGFFWGKDLEEAITGQQNKPITWRKT